MDTVSQGGETSACLSQCCAKDAEVQSTYLPFPRFWHMEGTLEVYTTVHYCTLLYTTVHYCTLLYTTVHYCTLLYTTVHFGTVLHSPSHQCLEAPTCPSLKSWPKLL